MTDDPQKLEIDCTWRVHSHCHSYSVRSEKVIFTFKVITFLVGKFEGPFSRRRIAVGGSRRGTENCDRTLDLHLSTKRESYAWFMRVYAVYEGDSEGEVAPSVPEMLSGTQ